MESWQTSWNTMHKLFETTPRRTSKSVDFPGECCIWDLSYVHVYANGNKNSRFCLYMYMQMGIKIPDFVSEYC